MNFSSVYLFTSWEFFVFLAVSLLGYFTVPKAIAAIGRTKALQKFTFLQNTQWIWLLISSVIFYISYYSFLSTKYKFGNTAYLFFLFLIASILSVYFSALIINRLTSKQKAKAKENPAEKKLIKKSFTTKKRLVILICCLINFGILSVLKYSGFAIENINNLGFSLTTLDWIILPLGISFYTFQCIGYIVDIYRGIIKPERNLFKFTLFIMYFPHIFQGPIGRYNHLAPQLFSAHKFNYEQTIKGIFRIVWGLFKKLVVADRVIIFINEIFSAHSEYSAPLLILAVVMNAIWLYADFSGYMDIALGASQIMGITLTENFDTPFFSLSVAEFWRRWHISLGSWFRDYLFYPISISNIWRKNKDKNAFGRFCAKNLGGIIGNIAVWLTMGIWHGASWNFVFEGVFFGIIIIVSNLLDKPFRFTNEKFKGWFFDFLRILRTFSLVAIGFLFFSANSLSQAIDILKNIATLNLSGAMSPFVPNFNKFSWAIALFGIVVMLIFEIIQAKKGALCDFIFKKKYIFRAVILLFLLVSVIIFGIYGSGEVSFAYFDF